MPYKNNQKNAIAIFAKNPHLTKVKTRLAKAIGQGRANEFYELSLACIDHELNKIDNLDIFYAIPDDLQHNYWQGKNLLQANNSNFGLCLYEVYNNLLAKNYQKICLYGTDSPHINHQQINNLIKNTDVISFAPTDDGGFYFMGGTVKLQSKIWEDVEYSANNTLDNLVVNIKKEGLKVKFHAKSFDIDEVSDLEKLQEFFLKRKKDLSPQQIALLNWLISSR